MFNWFKGLPAGFAQVFSFCVAVLCCLLFIWIFTWIQHWCIKYGTILPWP